MRPLIAIISIDDGPLPRPSIAIGARPSTPFASIVTICTAPVWAAFDEAMSPIRTDDPAPPSATWLAAVVVALVPIAVEPANWAEAKKPKAVAAAPLAELRAPTDIAPSPVASVFEPNTKASLPLAVELSPTTVERTPIDTDASPITTLWLAAIVLLPMAMPLKALDTEFSPMAMLLKPLDLAFAPSAMVFVPCDCAFVPT